MKGVSIEANKKKYSTKIQIDRISRTIEEEDLFVFLWICIWLSKKRTERKNVKCHATSGHREIIIHFEGDLPHFHNNVLNCVCVGVHVSLFYSWGLERKKNCGIYEYVMCGQIGLGLEFDLFVFWLLYIWFMMISLNFVMFLSVAGWRWWF